MEAQSLADARAALRTGQYADAERAYRSALGSDGASVEARRGLALTLLRVGRYDHAAAVARPGGAATGVELGRALRARGDLDGAEAAFRAAADAPGPQRLTARVDLGELLLERGRVDEAQRLFDGFIDVYNDANGRLSAPDLVAVGRAVRHLGRTDPVLFQDALRAFDRAAEADSAWPEPRIFLGELFLEKYQSPQAQDELQQALALDPRHPRARLTLARALEFDGTGGAREQAEAALEVNPNMVEAQAFLAGLDLTDEGYEEAERRARAALEVDPASLEALTALAATYFLAGRERDFVTARSRALALDPHYAGLDETVARLAEQTRRYDRAVERARAAVALDSTAWTAWGVMGLNQLRSGAIDQGRASLERAFAGDPYNPWFKNNLDLLDTFSEFETVHTEHFELFIHGSEAELLAPLVSEMAEEAYDSLSARYGIEPPLPQRVELYPSHADFSVRTLGEVGLGALGVSFGPVLVMDSPAARERGEYNWASVLWHELAHSFHLALTDHRVPRWFSEGLAVHEQRKGREGWGHAPSLAFLRALRDGRLEPVSTLNDGFMRPDYPEQVVFSYLEASLVFEFIEGRHGFGAIRRMLDGYREGATTEELVASVLDTTPERLDADFGAWMRDRYQAPLAGLAAVGEAPPPSAGVEALQAYLTRHPGDLAARLRLGVVLAERNEWDTARKHLEEVLKVFPDYGGPDSPYLYLARMHHAAGDDAREAAALARLNSLSESNYAALVLEADVNERLGRLDRAAWALNRALQVYPYDPGLHERLAQVAERSGDLAARVRARRAQVALNPTDRAEAYFQLALAQFAAGDRGGARTSVLAALEIAPNYEEALELLLDLRGGTEEAA